MKKSLKKISMSVIAGTIILGSVSSVGAECLYQKNTIPNHFHSYKYKGSDNKGEETSNPVTPNNNNTTTDKNNQDKTDQNQITPNNVSSMETEVLRLVNVERSKQGLSPLKLSNELSGVAQKKSQDMADKNYFSHTSPTYGSPFDMMKQFGINYTSAGENIAKGYASAQDVMNGWMNSPGHKANILSSNFGTLGVGYVNKGGTTYWTQMFTN